MANFSHLQKQFEAQEAARTPEERAERDRRHREIMKKRAEQDARLLEPYLRMERELAPIRAMMAAWAPLQLEEALVRAHEPFCADNVLTALYLTEALRISLGGPLCANVLLEAHAERGIFTDLRDQTLRERLLLGGLYPRLLADEEFFERTTLSSPMAVAEELLRIEAERPFIDFAELPPLHGGAEAADDIDVDASPERVDGHHCEEILTPTQPSLEHRRLTAYRVLREDARQAAVSGGALFDEMLGRVHALLSAMERDIENGHH